MMACCSRQFAMTKRKAIGKGDNMLQVQEGGHYSNQCDKEETVKTSNKQGSNLMY